MKKYEVYLASGWFSKQQEEDIENIKSALKYKNLEYFSPREDNLFQDGTKESSKAIFKGNVDAIQGARLIIVNTRDKDMGSIFEAGVAHAFNIPILYYSAGLKGDFNLMLAESGQAVATGVVELLVCLECYKVYGYNFYIPYEGGIE